MAGDARRDAKGGGAVSDGERVLILLVVLVVIGFVAACLESSLKNWEEESDDPR